MIDVYRAWSVNENEYPVNAGLQDKILFWLRYAILAPSAHNTQPWCFSIAGKNLLIHRENDHQLSISDPTYRQTYLALGACIENFCLAANHWGYETLVESEAFLVDEDPVAVIKILNNGKIGDEIFYSITKRHTDRGTYKSKLDFDLKGLLITDNVGSAKKIGVTRIKTIKLISELVGQAMGIGLSMGSLKEELSDFVYSKNNPADTGMALESMFKIDKNFAVSIDHQSQIKNMNGFAEGDNWRHKFAQCPVIFVIGSDQDGPMAWLDSGRLMQRTLLQGTTLGLCHDICAALVEIPTVWPCLRNIVNTELRPQVVFRMGVPLDNEMTLLSSRRPVKIL